MCALFIFFITLFSDMKKILVVDNNDSFVYNLVEYLRNYCTVEVILSSEIGFEAMGQYDGILLSPGAGLPKDYPKMMELIERCHTTHSFLGVCLGHQALCSFFGMELTQIQAPKHGHTDRLKMITENPLFQTLSDNSAIGRYHSWVATGSCSELQISAIDEEGNIMAVKHRNLPLYGVQFHPESIITEHGRVMIENWVRNL